MKTLYEYIWEKKFPNTELDYDAFYEHASENANEFLNLAFHYFEKQNSEMKAIFEEIENESEEVICSPIRFYGVSMERIQRVFEKHGIKIEPKF